MKSSNEKPPIYLLDSMAFIFRAYHAMQRSRPMTTRTGIPTAATYVFVNMINKLRADFKPEYLAAVYDVGAPVHRHEMAAQMKDVQKFNIKTQQFETIEYGGYKANRVETPPDLIQQQPYIRRALEAFRIPILYYEGFEADDVIGTLSCKLAEMGHRVFVVSSDKDMMQLVNENVSILNPTKDNLILGPEGVEKVLGVPPERVVDVMALRGDAIDNIPGAPGIGDKGSVELIQQFGTVEGALDRADEVKKKTYRESLQNNRENILLSKELVTIHTSVPIEFSIDAMRTRAVDNAACRALFTELEFTTLLKDLAPDVDAVQTTYSVNASAEELAKLLAEARAAGHLAVAMAANAQAVAEEIAAEGAEGAEGEVEAEPAPAETMSLFGAQESEPVVAAKVVESGGDPACRLGLAVTAAHAVEVGLDAPGLREAMEDASLPKQVHDLKAVLRALEPHGVMLRGDVTDVMLQSYLLNPTHGSHTLVDIAARTTSLALTHQVTKENPADPKRLAEAAAAVVRLAKVMGEHGLGIREQGLGIGERLVDEPGLGGAVTEEMLFPVRATAGEKQIPFGDDRKNGKGSDAGRELDEGSTLEEVYWKLDLPLVEVLLRMEQAGVRVDGELLREMSSRLAVTIDDLAERVYAISGQRFNINSPKQLGDVLFNKMDLPKPMKYGKGKVISTAQDVLEELSQRTDVAGHEVAAMVLEHRQLQKLKGTYLDALPVLADAQGRIHTTFNQVGTATGRLSSTNPNLQNIPIRTAVGREIRAAFVAAEGNLLMSADYSQIELRLMAHFSQDALLLDAYRTGKDIHTLTAAEVFGVDAATMDKETRARAKAVNFGIVYGISPFGLAAQLGIEQRVAKEYIARYFERYEGVAAFIERTLETVRRDQSVRTAFGRVRPIPDIQSRNPNQRGFAERTAVNTPLQGTAADLIKIAMLRIDAAMRERGLRSLMTLQVHDELLFDVVPEEADEMQELVKREMESAAEFSVPIVAEVGLGKNWRDIK
ncbi:MAG: DNA polymerase I [Acidobacteria bacterium]|nr:DNA polymerase I [Acidobacteriota bacterium]